jgi:hypothetical protein
VETLRAALAAVEWPGDELSVFAALKGSLFAISDTTLLQFRLAHQRLSPFLPDLDSLEPEFDAVKAALQLLKDLHNQRNWRRSQRLCTGCSNSRERMPASRCDRAAAGTRQCVPRGGRRARL